jgi:tetratricopeptide (TPR) repeat protein
LCAFALYVFLNLLFNNASLAFLTSLIFAVHPINGVMVNYITASVFGVQVLAMILSLMTFVLARENKKGAPRLALQGLSFFLFLVALFCHETSLALPFYLVGLLFVRNKYDLKQMALLSAPYFILAAGYFVFRMYFASLKVSILDKIAQFDISCLNYLATFSKIIVWYLHKLVTLDGIVLIWATAPVREHAWGWILALSAIVCLAGAMIKKYARSDPRTLGLLWFAAGFLPVSFACLFQPTVGMMMEPHWMLFPNIGFFLWVAYGLLLIREKWNALAGTLVILTLLVSYVTVSREYNRLWVDEKKYCQYWLQEVPGFKSVMFHQASAYMREGDYPRARKIFHEALDNWYHDFEIYINLGLMDFMTGRWPEAVANYNTALAISPKSAVAYTNLGAVYLKMDDFKSAEQCYLKAVSLNFFLVEPRLSLGRLYQLQGRREEATKAFEESFKIDPGDERVIFEVAKNDWQTGNKTRAVSLSKKLLFSSRDAGRLTSMGSFAAYNGYVNLASALFNRAIARDPHYPDGYLEMGKIYGNRGEFGRAIAVWQDGLRVAPADGRFRELILKAKEFKEEQ